MAHGGETHLDLETIPRGQQVTLLILFVQEIHNEIDVSGGSVHVLVQDVPNRRYQVSSGRLRVAIGS